MAFSVADYLKQRLLGTLVYNNTGPWVNNPNHANPQGPGQNSRKTNIWAIAYRSYVCTSKVKSRPRQSR